MALYYKKRDTNQLIMEKIEGEKALCYLYEKPLGQFALHTLVKRKWFSSLYGWFQDKPKSAKKIPSFVEKHNINLEESQSKNFKTFNEFFTRKLVKEARPIDSSEMHLISPADGRVFAYQNICVDSIVQIKGIVYSLEQLIGDAELAKTFEGGCCMVIRLSPVDYHRYHYPDSGCVKRFEAFPGRYYSVNPIALSKKINLYVENKREWMLLETKNFGELIMMEVGATCVGSIIQNHHEGDVFQKGDEKGYFKFGGSTVVLFFKKGCILVDEDIITNTAEGYETKVNMGEKIATKGSA